MPPWGEIGSRVRGTCYHYNAEKGFGFLRYLAPFEHGNAGEHREPNRPYREAFFHCTQCPVSLDLALLPSRDMVFEFTLAPGREESKTEANDLALVISYAPPGTQR